MKMSITHQEVLDQLKEWNKQEKTTVSVCGLKGNSPPYGLYRAVLRATKLLALRAL